VNQAQQQGPTSPGILQDVAPDATPARSPSGHQSKDLNDSVSIVEVKHSVECYGACSWVCMRMWGGGREAVPTHCSM
jgi:hypothetical protein